MIFTDTNPFQTTGQTKHESKFHLSVFLIRRIKVVQELPEDLILGPLPVLILWVALGVVDPSQVFDGDHPVACLIQLPKRLHHHLLARLGHLRLEWTDNGGLET